MRRKQRQAGFPRIKFDSSPDSNWDFAHAQIGRGPAHWKLRERQVSRCPDHKKLRKRNFVQIYIYRRDVTWGTYNQVLGLISARPKDTEPTGANETSNSISNSSLGGTKYACSRQKANEVVKVLRDCGTEELITLAKIAVIGDQSAARKSSLIEAISQIKLPRASGTCTRCPVEVILTSATKGGWNATYL